MPRFLVSLTRGVLELFRLAEPRPVTLADGTTGEARDLTPLRSSPDATNGPTLAPGDATSHIPVE